LHHIKLLSLTVPVKHNVIVPVKRTVPSTLKVLQKMENPKGNPFLALIKNFADNPQKFQEGLEKLLNEGPEKVCRYLLDILALRDKNTAHHANGVAKIATKLSKEIGLSSQETEKIRIAALGHDLGKLYTPLKILKKPGKLNEYETAVTRKHALRTKQLLEQLGLTRKNDIFKNAAELAENHHTSIDKLNLTRKKTMEEEVLELSDVFSALTIKRDYKKPQPPQKALEAMKNMQKDQKLWNSELFEKFTKFVEKTYCKK